MIAAPRKRQRLEDRRRVDHENEGYVTTGPLPSSTLGPLDLFEPLIATNLPTFSQLKPYSASVDPVYPFHIRVTLNSTSEARNLVEAWSTGHRIIGMREMTSDGSQDSISRSADFNESVSHSGHRGRPQGSGSNHRAARRDKIRSVTAVN